MYELTTINGKIIRVLSVATLEQALREHHIIEVVKV